MGWGEGMEDCFSPLSLDQDSEQNVQLLEGGPFALQLLVVPLCLTLEDTPPFRGATCLTPFLG